MKCLIQNSVYKNQTTPLKKLAITFLEKMWNILKCKPLLNRGGLVPCPTPEIWPGRMGQRAGGKKKYMLLPPRKISKTMGTEWKNKFQGKILPRPRSKQGTERDGQEATQAHFLTPDSSVTLWPLTKFQHFFFFFANKHS